MSTSVEVKGSCLCGAVEIEAKSASTHIEACHCSNCQTWSGGPLLATECKDQVQLKGIEYVSTFSSSKWAERGFCSQCGTHLFYRLKQQNHYTIPVGLLQINSEITFSRQIFIDEKPEFYDFSNNTKKMTGKEVFEEYATKP